MAYGYFKPVAVGFIIHPADIIIIIAARVMTKEH